MKKFMFLLMAFVLVLFCTGCGPKPAAYKSDCPIPEFIENPPVAEDAFYGTGDAVKFQMNLATQAADARARTAIANAVEVKVQTMLKDFLEQGGVGENSRALEWTSSVSKQVANTVLKGAVVVKRKICPEGDQYHAYSLVRYPLQSLIEETLKTIKNEEALFNEFKAQMRFDELEKTVKEMKAN